MSVDQLRFGLLLLPIIILSLSVHEYAHALVAFKLGDTTAQKEGRLTLNPLAHIDWVGTVIIPLVATTMNVILPGWAKPVPCNPVNFHRGVSMRTGMALVAVAGPLSNLILAILAAALDRGLGLLDYSVLLAYDTRVAHDMMRLMVAANCTLAIFNMLPLPPLDGSRLLPRSLDGLQAAVAPYAGIVLIICLYVPFVRELIFGSSSWLVRAIYAMFGNSI